MREPTGIGWAGVGSDPNFIGSSRPGSGHLSIVPQFVVLYGLDDAPKNGLQRTVTRWDRAENRLADRHGAGGW